MTPNSTRKKDSLSAKKTDIFKGILWFSYRDDPSNWHELTKDQVKEILEKNKKKEKVASLEEYTITNFVPEEKVFENVVRPR